MNDQLLDPAEVAGRLGVSLPMIYRLVDRREIGCTRIGRAIRFTPEHVADYIRAHEVPAAK